MGSKNRYLIFILFSFNVLLNAQGTLDFKYIDSLTYSYYTLGEWNKLIGLAEYAIDNNIDYLHLRQRLGYAFFSKGNYTDAKYQFEKALSFDSYNQFTLELLYYSYLNIGKEEYAGIFARRLNPELRKSLSITSFKLIESIEAEYNFKYAGTKNRSNPQYYRLGINTKLGNRFTLYQSLSNYNQDIAVQQIGNIETISVRQPEYYALLKYFVSNHLLLKTAYHYINSTSDSFTGIGNFAYLAVSQDVNRFSFEANGSVLSFGQGLTYQAGIQSGFLFPGKSNFYLSGTFSGLFRQDTGRFIYNQKAGLKVLNKISIEGNLTFGRMTNYNDYNGLYVYNSYDPITFRSGATMFFYLSSKITLWANYSFERKEYFENSSFHYNQFSYLGGVKWKL